MAITRKQRIAMAGLVLAGVLGGAAVLWSDRPGAGGETAGHDEAGHDDRTARAEHRDGHAAAERNERDASAPGAVEPEHGDREVRLNDLQTKAAGIELRTAGGATLRVAARFPGEIRFDDDRTSHVVPRLAGVAEAVPAQLGQRVRQGQVLAVIASTALSDQRSELLTAQRRRAAARATLEREKTLWEERISAKQDYLQARTALQEADIAVQNAAQKLAAVGATGATGPSTRLNRFEVRAPLAGTIVEKHLSLGESVAENATIFTVSDLASVWVEFAVAPKDLATVRVGQRVVVSSTAFDSRAEGTIAYVGALLGEQTRTARARVTLVNPQGAWRPGLFVTVAVLGEDRAVPLAVGADAVQTVDERPTVFVAVPGGFVARPVRLGRSDGATVEILDGLKPGESYASTNTFVLKSELGKASADHGH